MAHFAEVKNGVVGQILVIGDSDCGGGDFPASEPIGQAFIASLGFEGNWLQTSYNNNFRGMYASGCRYNEEEDIFFREPIPRIDEQ